MANVWGSGGMTEREGKGREKVEAVKGKEKVGFWQLSLWSLSFGVRESEKVNRVMWKRKVKAIRVRAIGRKEKKRLGHLG